MSALSPLPATGSPEYQRLVSRRTVPPGVRDAVRKILEQVRTGGDQAVLDLTERFDGVRLPTSRVPVAEADAALAGLDHDLRRALEQMARRIEAVHRAQLDDEPVVDVVPGIRVWREWRPFTRVGLYVPGGRTAYPSSVLMLAIPARLAGCQEIVICSPPAGDGHVAPSILAAAAIAGVSEIHAVGGAQAIAALAYGTASIKPVVMIAGPGNHYVTAAKLEVYGEVAIDMPAGPSELVIISDGAVNRDWLRGDLLAQAEHAPEALSVLLTTARADAAVVAGIDSPQLTAYLADSVEAAVAFANAFAPEHLMLAVEQPERWLPKVSNAGSVFLGSYGGASAGDYGTGANHVLPTGGAARSFGALGVRSFGRSIQVQQIDAAGMPGLVALTDVLSHAEALPWHGRSLRSRLS